LNEDDVSGFTYTCMKGDQVVGRGCRDRVADWVMCGLVHPFALCGGSFTCLSA
jgi:hypothetical protein